MSRIDASASDKRSRETPHARGEDALIAEASVLSAETPPRTWGRHQHIVFSSLLKHQIYDNCTPQGFRVSFNIHPADKIVSMSPPSTGC